MNIKGFFFHWKRKTFSFLTYQNKWRIFFCFIHYYWNFFTSWTKYSFSFLYPLILILITLNIILERVKKMKKNDDVIEHEHQNIRINTLVYFGVCMIFFLFLFCLFVPFCWNVSWNPKQSYFHHHYHQLIKIHRKFYSVSYSLTINTIMYNV